MSLCSPDEGFRMLVMQSHIVVDRADEFGQASKHAVAQTLGGQIAEETFDHIQPGG